MTCQSWPVALFLLAPFYLSASPSVPDWMLQQYIPYKGTIAATGCAALSDQSRKSAEKEAELRAQASLTRYANGATITGREKLSSINDSGSNFARTITAFMDGQEARKYKLVAEQIVGTGNESFLCVLVINGRNG